MTAKMQGVTAAQRRHAPGSKRDYLRRSRQGECQIKKDCAPARAGACFFVDRSPPENLRFSESNQGRETRARQQAGLPAVIPTGGVSNQERLRTRSRGRLFFC